MSAEDHWWRLIACKYHTIKLLKTTSRALVLISITMADVAVRPLKRLVLSFKSETCSLSPSELQAYPDSLLSKIASNEDGSTFWESANEGQQSAGTLSNFVMSEESSLHIKLDGLPNNPLNEWLEALQIVPMLYRCDVNESHHKHCACMACKLGVSV